MKELSRTANSIEPSLTRQLFNEAKKYNDVIDFTLGDPDIQPAEEIKTAGCKAIMEGKTRYSQNAGLLELRQIISRYCIAKEHLNYNPQTEIIVSVGAMEAVFLALASMINDGDEVVFPAPYYVNYKQMVEICHGVPVIVSDNDGADTLTCSVEAIRAAITPKTKAIILNTPSNPSGKIFSWEFVEGVADIAREHDLYVLTDEVYKCLVYGGAPRPKSIATLPDMKERTLYINSLSKEFCMTGWRIGYALGPTEIITAMTKLQENVAACAPLPSQYAAMEALRLDKDYSANMASIFAKRRDALVEEIQKCDKLHAIVPDATFYMMVNIKETGMNSVDFAYSLLKHAHVAVVPGITYGKICDTYIRIAFTLDEDLIREGVRRIVKYVNSLKK